MLPGLTSDLALVTGSGGGATGPYGGGSLDTQTVTTGSDGTAINGNRRRGFVLSQLGGCSSGASALYGGATIQSLLSSQDPNGGFDVVFGVAGVQANSGWASMNVGGSHILLRTNATFSTSGGNTSWTWVGAGQLFSGTVVVGFD